MTRIRPAARADRRTLACFALFAALFVATADAHAERRAQRHFDLVNASHDRIVALAISPADQGAFRDIAIGAPLRGGRDATTFEVPEGGCLRDLRIEQNGGRVLLYPRIDVCRYRGLTVTPRDGKSPRTGRALARSGAVVPSPPATQPRPN